MRAVPGTARRLTIGGFRAFLFDLALPMYRILAAVSGKSFFWLTVGRLVV